MEREIKLSLPGRFAIPDLSMRNETMERVDLPQLDLRAMYFDTSGLRLARQGVTLRHRTGEAPGPRWTLKLPAVPSDGVAMNRDELHFPAPRREPPPEVKVLVTVFARTEPLVAVATLRTKRRRWMFRHEGVDVAELADDEVSVLEGRRIVSRFRELELEAISDGAPLEELAEQLRAAGAADAEPIPKVVRALGSRATAPPDIRPSPPVPSPTVSEALAASISDALTRWMNHDPATRLGDAEALHQLRVAVRRLRSDLRTLDEVLVADWADRVEPRLRALADALADARDLDVLMETLTSEAASAPDLAPLFTHLENRRRDARSVVSAAMTNPDYPQLLDELVEAANSPPVRADAVQAAAALLPSRVLAGWARLEKRADKLRATSSDEDFHRARIATKRVRYASELVARILGGKQAVGAARLGKRLAELQDALGIVQDAAVAEAAIRATISTRARTPGYPFEAGRLVERQRQRADLARQSALETWTDLRRRRWRKWVDE